MKKPITFGSVCLILGFILANYYLRLGSEEARIMLYAWGEQTFSIFQYGGLILTGLLVLSGCWLILLGVLRKIGVITD